MLAKRRSRFLLLAILGLAVRTGFVLAANSRQLTFHSGGSDAPIYVLLAKNLLSHKGFTYAGQPSALYPPGYPLILAGFITLFGGHYIIVIRWLQFILGLVTVGICAAAALRLSSRKSAEATFIFGLFLPTLIFSTAQVLTECVSAFLTALFLLFLVKQYENADLPSAGGLGLTAGFESLIRFNAAALPLIAAWGVFRTWHKKPRFWRGVLVVGVPLLVVLPWLVRNELVFHGHVLFSTQTGLNAVIGVVSPEGRTQPGDTQRLFAAMGWRSQPQAKASRLSTIPEVEVNRNGLRVAARLWKEKGWNAIPLLGKKVADFWFSTDQLIDTKSFPLSDRLIRAGGVLVYWLVLAFAIGGWFHLRKVRPCIASIFLVYLIAFTLLHLPLVMNTRLRIPLLGPLVVILSGIGWTRLGVWARNKEEAEIGKLHSQAVC